MTETQTLESAATDKAATVARARRFSIAPMLDWTVNR